MASNTSPVAEIINTLQEILHNVQSYSQNAGFYQESDFFKNLLPFFQVVLKSIARLGQDFPKQLQWSKKLQTIASLEESSHTTPKNVPNVEQSSPNSTSHISSSHDDISAIQGTPIPEQNSPSSTSHISSSHNVSATHDTPGVIQDPTLKSTAKDDARVNALLKKLDKQKKDFHSWIQAPSSFWGIITEELQLEGLPDDERFRKYCEHVVQQQSNAGPQKYIHRFDSVIIYLRYRRFTTYSTVRTDEVKKFLRKEKLSIERYEEYRKIIFGGRRRVELCHLLSQDDAEHRLSQGDTELKEFHPDDVKFNVHKWAYLFVDHDDRM
ncbi:hypothetical protein V8C35DRAFT_27667 [Trichoderma chlorosporum]